MTSLRRFLTRLLNSLTRREQDERLREEIEEHIALQTEENLRRGLSPIEARRQAMLRFGGVEAMKQDYRAERGLPLIENLLHDVRFALRLLRKSPSFTAVAILTLAMGIGANAAIFTLVRGVLLKPLVNRDEDRLIYIRQSAPGMRDENTTFSVPEIQDLHASVKSLSAFGDFSTISFTVIGLGEPREANAGVVSGSYFDVMGLHPVLGRLVGPQDDGPKAAGVVVLTYRFWSNTLKRDPSVIGRTVRLGGLGDRSARIIGVLEPCVPYPQDTEIIANVVTSPHHLSATMVTGRVHRMTELFARLAPGSTLEQARAELRSVYATMKKDHPDAYSKQADFQISAKLLRDQITSGARTVLLLLLAASALVFIIACSNVANLILARTVRREGELAVRTTLGASMLITTLISLQRTRTGMDTRHVLAINAPAMSYGKTHQQVVDFYREVIRRVEALPGVNKTAFGMIAPWRDAGSGPRLQFSADGYVHRPGEEDPRAQYRTVSPGFFAALGVPIIAGRDFNELDTKETEPVAIISETLAQRMFPNQDPVNRHVYWTDPVLKITEGTTGPPQRIIGVAGDIDDEHLVPEPTITIYHTFEQGPLFRGRLFIHTDSDPYSLVTPVTRIIRDMSADQPIEHATTLEDARAEVLTPHRLSSVVFGVFAAVALAIAVVGVAGMLAFSVSARTREFGIRLALGSQPQRILRGVIAEGALLAAVGVLAGAALGFVLARLAGKYFLEVKMPGALPAALSGLVLITVAVVASMLPAARAARVDVMQVLRSE